MQNTSTATLNTKYLIYIYEAVISVCSFACPIITHETLDRFASNILIGEFGRIVEMNALFKKFKLSMGWLLYRKFSFLAKLGFQVSTKYYKHS